MNNAKAFTQFESIFDALHALADNKTPFNLEEYRRQCVDDYNRREGELNKYDGYNCTLCKNKGFIASLGEGFSEVHTICKCSKNRATLKRARESGLGDIISDYTFDKYIATEPWQMEIKEAAQRFCEDEDARWFYIGGQVGAGKTHLCTAICGYYIKAGLDVKYMLWNEEAKKLKALVNDKSYQDEIAVYKNSDVLYIDDFFKVKHGEAPTNGDINLAFEIINHRLLSREKITVISSEKQLSDILSYDEATVSRIIQKTGNYRISLGADMKKNYSLK